MDVLLDEGLVHNRASSLCCEFCGLWLKHSIMYPAQGSYKHLPTLTPTSTSAPLCVLHPVLLKPTIVLPFLEHCAVGSHKL